MFINLKLVLLDNKNQYSDVFPIRVKKEKISCYYPAAERGTYVIIDGNSFLVDDTFSEISAMLDTSCACKANRWIPCNEILPDHDDDYLVSLIHDPHYKYSVDIDTFKGGKWKTYGKKVIGWMPFPEPLQ